MKIRRLLYSAFLLLLTLSSTTAFAQFEGQISINLYSNEDGETDVSTMNLFATSDRIMVKGEENVDLMENMSTDGFLIRNDMKDFVIMTGEDQALQVTKEEIEGLVEMFSGWGDDSSSEEDHTIKTDYRFSDRTQKILGYDTAELIITDSENPDQHLSVWLTPDIDINWGMLAEKWNNMPDEVDKELNGMGQEIFFKGKNFPLLIEGVEGEVRTKVMEVTNVNKSSVAKAMVEIPPNVKLMSFKDYVFNMMMEQ